MGARSYETSYSEYWKRNSSTYQLIVDHIDTTVLMEKYEEVLTFFQDEIQFDGYVPQIVADKAHYNKAGLLFTFSKEAKKHRVEYLALSKEPLEPLMKFLSLLGKISSLSIRPIFSPEEEVLQSYFVFARLVLPRVVDDHKLRSFFTRAFEDFEQERHEGAVAAIGLVGEDYLTRIFETLFREQCPKGYTLGQLFDAIQSNVGRIFKKEPSQPPDIDALYKTIAAAIDRHKTTADVDAESVLAIIRQVVNVIREDRICNRGAFQELRKASFVTSVFPSRVREDLNELIRYRNAASHKTRVPLGAFEAQRTMYCLFSLIMWWQEELDTIDWLLDSEAIIRDMVGRANPAK